MAFLRLSFASAIVCFSLAGSAQADSNLSCKIGPVERTYGGTKWLVYGCDDKASLVIVTETDNPAMPFVFFVTQTKDGYQLHGEGTGDKHLTDAAYKDLAALTDADINALAAATVVAGKN